MMQIPDDYIELERIYAATLARDVRSLAVVSTCPCEGVSTVIKALARRNLIAGHSTLLVDLNLHSPNLGTLFNLEALPARTAQLSSPHSLALSEIDTKLALVTGPADRRSIVTLREPGSLEKHIENWLNDYDSVLIDTSPISLNNSGNLPGERAAGACDGAILTVLAGQTTETAITNTVDKLKLANALLLGCVINDQFNPTLKSELLREVKRIDRFLPKLAAKFRSWIYKNYLLNLEV